MPITPDPFIMASMIGRIALCLSLGVAMAAPAHARTDAASARQKNGITVRCIFPKAGAVSVNTRPGHAQIRVGRRTYAATPGSYFYQTRDGAFAMMYTPDMRLWTLRKANGVEEDSRRCRTFANAAR